MAALIRDNDTFEIKLYHVVGVSGKDSFVTTPGEDEKYASSEELAFTFKRPTWGDTRKIMGRSVSFVDGKGEIDPYALMDSRIKVLLKSWTLKGEDGKPMEATPENVERLPSDLVEAIHEAMIDLLSTTAR